MGRKDFFMAVTGKIDRKYMAHFLDAGSLCGGLTPKYERLGKDLEEYRTQRLLRIFLVRRASSTMVMKLLPKLIRSMRKQTPTSSKLSRRL